MDRPVRAVLDRKLRAAGRSPGRAQRGGRHRWQWPNRNRMTLWFYAFPAALPHRAPGSFARLPRPRNRSSGGARGFTVPACTMDVRAGGTWHTVMRAPEGKDHIVSGVYREIMPPERLVLTWAWEKTAPAVTRPWSRSSRSKRPARVSS
ncbi:MAG: SRPBCC domain-containing protein [Geminicoccaceae bacterium]